MISNRINKAVTNKAVSLFSDLLFLCLLSILILFLFAAEAVSNVSGANKSLVGNKSITAGSELAGQLSAADLKEREIKNTEPYGANLFKGAFQANRDSGLNPDYRIAAGDKVSLNVWGLVTIQSTMTVDPNGNIFIPEIGPVRLGGVRSADLSSVVKRKIATVYKEGVESYVTLLSSTPISLFVTGEVLRPGQYSGLPTDSILTYLQQAGGIHADRGSYRRIRVMRGQRVISTLDLYQFLRWGRLPPIRLKDGDTILVEPQGMTVTVLGQARVPLKFEFANAKIRGQVLNEFSRPNPRVTHVEVSGARKGQPWTSYANFNRFKGLVLEDGDVIRYLTDSKSDIMTITLEGSFKGTSRFSIKAGTRLKELLDYVPVQEGVSDIRNIYIKRKSIAARQKKNLELSLSRLERSVLTSPAKSDGEASLRAKEAEMVLKYVARAKGIMPEGRLVVSDNGYVGNILLEDGDVVVIPQRSDVVMVDGEVNIPQAIMYAPNASVFDYIARAGGYSERAEQVKVLLIKPSGQIITDRKVPVTPGDQVIVYPRIDRKPMPFAKDLIQIIYQIAVAAKAVGI